MAAMVQLELVLAAALLAAMFGPQQGGGADVWAELAAAHGGEYPSPARPRSAVRRRGKFPGTALAQLNLSAAGAISVPRW
jgi:hypothetical protein